MNIDRMVSVGINYPVAVKRLNGKVELYLKLLHYFLIDQNFISLENYLKIEKYEDAFNACHTFKGIVGNLSMTKLYELAIKLTDHLRYHEYDKAIETFPIVKKEYEIIFQVLKEELNNNQ